MSVLNISRMGCVNGKCVEADPDNCCICETGWQGEKCDQCVPYWDCPERGNSACVRPNECICNTPSINDPKGLCGNANLTLPARRSIGTSYTRDDAL